MFSPQLWTEDGLASQAGDKTFWDRSTLYALRGLFAAGDTKQGLQYLQYYSNRRLLGEHVPYPVEAYPEGNQRHLSAESGLYCRIYTEGLFGIRPVALNTCTITPQLPAEWNFMQMKQVHGYQQIFDVDIKREGSNRFGYFFLRKGSPYQVTLCFVVAKNTTNTVSRKRSALLGVCSSNDRHQG